MEGMVRKRAAVAAVGGIINLRDQDRLARALFRGTRGNTFAHFQPVERALPDPKTGEDVYKSAFVVYFQGSAGSSLDVKVKRVCTAFGATIYDWPNSSDEAARILDSLERDLQEKESALEAGKLIMKGEMAELLAPAEHNPSGNSLVEDWRLFCRKEKSVYAILNLCEDGLAMLRVNCWYPEKEKASIDQVLGTVKRSSVNT